MSGRELHLSANLMGSGWLQSAWRAFDGDPRAFVDVAHLQKCGRIAERGTFDAVFLADTPALVMEDVTHVPPYGLEPTVSLAAVSAVTERVGLVATLSTTFNEPYNLARRILALDHVSSGRAGWNIVTTRSAGAARNFGSSTIDDSSDRYERASEFVDVALALWDSWEEDAFVGDAETGQFADPTKIHPIDHDGRYYSVHGPLPMPRSPQGRPVLVQAGYSDHGLDFAARYADILFTVQNDFDAAQLFYDRMKLRVAQRGRDPEKFLIMPALPIVMGGTEAEAQARWAHLEDLVPLDGRLENLAGRLHVQPDALHPDRELPLEILPAESSLPEVERGWFNSAVSLAVTEHLTVRQLIARIGRGAAVFAIGTPDQIADRLVRWHSERACDGFMLNLDVLPSSLETFVEHVVPELRRRKAFRNEYGGRTMRENLGLEL